MHRVSGPWLKLLSAVGIVPCIIVMLMQGKSSAQHSRSDNRMVTIRHLRGAHQRPLTRSTRERRRERGPGVHRVSTPWLKLLSAVGVILLLIMMMRRGRSSAQHSRSDNHLWYIVGTYAVHTCARSPGARGGGACGRGDAGSA